jgi:type IV secretory pathway VirB3-like protein
MTTTPTERINPVYKTLNKVLMFMGIERSLFCTSAAVGMAIFVLFDSLFAASVSFVCLLLVARQVTHDDPQMLTFILNAGRFRVRYDPCKYRPLDVRRITVA